jgi:hypothetical protein
MSSERVRYPARRHKVVLRVLAEEIQQREQGKLAVDKLELPYGREALIAGAEAAMRAEVHHKRALDAAHKAAMHERALEDGLKAARWILENANLTKPSVAAAEFAQATERVLQVQKEQPGRRRGSPGRPIHAAAAEAAAAVWARATGRRIPRTGKANDDHPLESLLRAISADLFGSGGAMSISTLSKKSTPNNCSRGRAILRADFTVG